MNILLSMDSLIISIEIPATAIVAAGVLAFSLSVSLKIRVGKWLRIKGRGKVKHEGEAS